MNTETQNSQNKISPTEAKLNSWCWGAFLLTWIWGLGNRTWRALWCLVPVVNIFMWIALGVKGRQWAWDNGKWQSVEHFNRVQRTWSIVGLIVFLLTIVIGLLGFIHVSMQHPSMSAEHELVAPTPTQPAATNVPTKAAVPKANTNTQTTRLWARDIVKYLRASAKAKSILGANIKRRGRLQSDYVNASHLNGTLRVRGNDSNGVVHFTACMSSNGWKVLHLTYVDAFYDGNTVTLTPNSSTVCQ